MDPRSINFLSLQTLELPFQRNAQRQAGVKVFIAGCHTQTGGIQRIVQNGSFISENPSIIKKGKGIEDSRWPLGHSAGRTTSAPLRVVSGT